MTFLRFGFSQEEGVHLRRASGTKRSLDLDMENEYCHHSEAPPASHIRLDYDAGLVKCDTQCTGLMQRGTNDVALVQRDTNNTPFVQRDVNDMALYQETINGALALIQLAHGH